MSDDDFEITSIPEAEREDMCRALLEEFGATRIRGNAKGELVTFCVLPWHDNTKTPAASLNWKKLVYNCLEGNTPVKTYYGERPIRDLAGGRHLLLDGAGKWVEAEVKAYGIQRLYRVVLTRNGVEREVYATADHRWLTRAQGSYQAAKTKDLVEKTTATLRPKDRIPSIWPHARAARTKLSRVGVMAGFVFGDGSRTHHGSVANFCGPKDEPMLEYFASHAVRQYGDVKKITSGLPRSWKALPSLDEGSSYLYGWLAGYFAADGCVSETGTVTLHSADRSVLEFATTVCDRLGIAAYGISTQSRLGNGAVESDMHKLTLRASTVPAEFFLLPEHRRRHEAAAETRKYERTHWWVSRVEETDRVEEVYCAEVSTTHSFVLGGNILTGNCFSCGGAGGIIWLIGICRGETTGQARDWLVERSGLGPDGPDLAALLAEMDALEVAQPGTMAPIPRMSERVLQPWRWIHPYLTEHRHVPAENVIALRVGFAERYPLGEGRDGAMRYGERIIYPHFWGGHLVGWQSRRWYDDGTPKYLSTPDFPRDRTIYAHDPQRDWAVWVESPTSVLRHHHHLPIEATFGSEVTDAQVRAMASVPRWVLWPDPDDAGWKALEGYERPVPGTRRTEHVPGLAERLEPYSDVLVVESPYAADPADMDDETVAALVASAVPFAVWERPRKLLCWLCREHHVGRCP